MTKQKSDLSRAFSEDGAIKTHVGGQALIEGVMMRGKYNWAVAVREPDGAIYVDCNIPAALDGDAVPRSGSQKVPPPADSAAEAALTRGYRFPLSAAAHR